MDRHPWRNRTFLAGLFNAIVGAVAAVFVYLGLDGTLHVVEASLVPAVLAVLDVAVTLGILRDGEAETTPVHDPLGADLLPLMPFRKLEDLTEAARDGHIGMVRELLGLEDHDLVDHEAP